MSTHTPRDRDALPDDAEPDQDDLAGEVEALRRQAQADPQGFADLIRRLLVEDEDDGRDGAPGTGPSDGGRTRVRPPTLH